VLEKAPDLGVGDTATSWLALSPSARARRPEASTASSTGTGLAAEFVGLGSK
jgi:hypothetical protein